MTVIQKRNRLVSFRLSDQEYDELCVACNVVGARSISDLARTAVTELVGSSVIGADDPLSGEVRNVNRMLRQLRQRVDQLSRKVAATERPVDVRSAS